MENLKNANTGNTLTPSPNRIKQFSTIFGCRGTRSRFDLSRRYC